MAIARVQSAKIDTDATGTTQACAYGSNVTAGNFLIAAFGWATFAATDPDTPTSIVDTLGNTWTQLRLGWESNIQTHFGIWYAKNILGGANTLTFTLPISRQGRALIIAEYSGVHTTAPIDIDSAALVGTTTNGTDGEVSSSVSTTADGCMVMSVIGWGQSTTATAGTGETEVQNTGNGFTTRLQMQEKLQASHAPITSTWTMGTSALKKVSFNLALAPAPAAVALASRSLLGVGA